ncbi:hypothetical protein [Herbaspirillum sp. ST 5-3]|uniref:hypothetical protein n=1 Tax=Oxalobacteraceae TaxID=75682 RepID=UPI0010A2B666|nr:hypothetical protein [Herbaspirillum sp. ST 5-3]
MKNSAKSAATLMAIGVLMLSLSACQKKEVAEEKGPAEKAGQQIDQAAARAGTELNKATEKAGQAMQQLGQKLQDEAQDMQKAEGGQDKQKKE